MDSYASDTLKGIQRLNDQMSAVITHLQSFIAIEHAMLEMQKEMFDDYRKMKQEREQSSVKLQGEQEQE